jgi:hypothetical protein
LDSKKLNPTQVTASASKEHLRLVGLGHCVFEKRAKFDDNMNSNADGDDDKDSVLGAVFRETGVRSLPDWSS